MKHLILFIFLSAVFITLPSQADKKLLQTNKRLIDLETREDHALFGRRNDQVFITEYLYVSSSEKSASDFKIVFINNQCEIYSYIYDISKQSQYWVHSLDIHKTQSENAGWLVDMHIVGNRSIRLICRFPKNQFQKKEDIQTDHITKATSGIVIFKEKK